MVSSFICKSAAIYSKLIFETLMDKYSGVRSLPGDFISLLKPVLGAEWPSFLEAVSSPPVKAAHPHPIKKKAMPPQRRKAVPWCQTAYYLPYDEPVTWDPFFQAGAYYVQEPGTLFLTAILSRLYPQKKPEKILDLCASPGGKTTQLLSFIASDSLLVANEVVKNRLSSLKQNIIKWAGYNTLVTHADPARFAALPEYFDLIVADVPCSGEGMFRKEPEAIKAWSVSHIKACSIRQQKIILSALPSLKPGGYLIYSTCTFNPIENEDNVKWLMKEYGMMKTTLEIPSAWNIKIYEETGAYQLYPHRNESEGFFLALLKKNGQAKNSIKTKTQRNVNNDWSRLPDAMAEILEPFTGEMMATEFLQHKNGMVRRVGPRLPTELPLLARTLGYTEAGYEVGQIIRNNILPAHPLALDPLADHFAQRWELTREEALRFMQKKELPEIPAARGWHLATYEGLGIGWAKLLGNRYNNYFPTEWKIRDDES